MINNIKNIFLFLFLIIPITLITGPAIPDLSITFGGIFCLIWIILKEEKKYLIQNSFIQISIIFWLSLIIISFYAFNKEKSFQESIIFLRYLFIPICCYYIFFTKNKILNYLLLITFISVIFVLLDTMFQFFNYSSRDGFGEDLLGFKSHWYGRLTGPFGDELIPGSYVSKFGLVGFAFLLINKSFQKINFVQVIYLSIILVVSFVSGERMAFATFSLALIMLFLFLNKKRITIGLSILIGLVLIFTLIQFHPFYNDYKVIESNQYHQGLKIEKEFECDYDENKKCNKVINIQPSFLEIIKNFKTSAYGEIYILAFQMFKDNPITGIGINNFNYLCENINEYKKMMVNYNCTSHPHNTYIQWLTEGGLIIFFIFLIYLFIICNFIIKNKGDKELKIIALVLILILFWPIMSTGSIIKNWYGISVFFIIAISLCLSRIKTNN